MPVPQNQKLRRGYNKRLGINQNYKDNMFLFRLLLSRQPDLKENFDKEWQLTVMQSGKADADAYLKFLLDAGQDILYKNDRQVVRIQVDKVKKADNKIIIVYKPL